MLCCCRSIPVVDKCRWGNSAPEGMRSDGTSGSSLFANCKNTTNTAFKKTLLKRNADYASYHACKHKALRWPSTPGTKAGEVQGAAIYSPEATPTASACSFLHNPNVPSKLLISECGVHEPMIRTARFCLNDSWANTAQDFLGIGVICHGGPNSLFCGQGRWRPSCSCHWQSCGNQRRYSCGGHQTLWREGHPEPFISFCSRWPYRDNFPSNPCQFLRL
jgi:hypothetical protein